MPDANADPTPLPDTGRCVFVYGTLRRGQANDMTRLQPAPRLVGQGWIAGTMYHLGGCPGVVLGEQMQPGGTMQGGAPVAAPSVAGEVYAIEPALERLLDEIEEIYPQRRDEYRKREVPVQVAGQRLQCLVYEINPAYVAGVPVIASGDWLLRDG